MANNSFLMLAPLLPNVVASPFAPLAIKAAPSPCVKPAALNSSAEPLAAFATSSKLSPASLAMVRISIMPPAKLAPLLVYWSNALVDFSNSFAMISLAMCKNWAASSIAALAARSNPSAILPRPGTAPNNPVVKSTAPFAIVAPASI